MLTLLGIFFGVDLVVALIGAGIGGLLAGRPGWGFIIGAGFGVVAAGFLLNFFRKVMGGVG